MNVLGRNCDTCRHFMQANTEGGTSAGWGHCRRRSPVLFNRDKVGVWPEVGSFDWCGEWSDGYSERSTWTTTKPTAEGCYWYVSDPIRGMPTLQPFVVFVTASGAVLAFGHEEDCTSSLTGGKWSGPIQPPE